MGQFLNETHRPIKVRETTRCLKEDETLLCVLLKGALLGTAGAQYYAAIRHRISSSNNRALASGMKMVKKIKQDGTRSKRQRTLVPVNSSIMGFMERYPAFPYCRETAFNEDHPEAFLACLPLCQQVDGLFQQHAPAQHARQSCVAQGTNPTWLIPGTTFTTVTLNKNFRTAAHKDAGDLPDGFGCISLHSQGVFSGGELVFPRYGVGLELEHGDLALFDPHEVHGNTQIKPISKAWERVTSVFYYRKDMVYCGTPEEELARAQSGLRTKK
jgi:hypothetical protein